MSGKPRARQSGSATSWLIPARAHTSGQVSSFGPRRTSRSTSSASSGSSSRSGTVPVNTAGERHGRCPTPNLTGQLTSVTQSNYPEPVVRLAAAVRPGLDARTARVGVVHLLRRSRHPGLPDSLDSAVHSRPAHTRDTNRGGALGSRRDHRRGARAHPKRPPGWRHDSVASDSRARCGRPPTIQVYRQSGCWRSATRAGR